MEKLIMDKIPELNYDMKEAFRTLRTNLLFCGDDVQAVLVTSSQPNEGKSQVTMNLAISLATSGKKVVLVDTDIRQSVIVGTRGIHREQLGKIYGLSHYLTGQKTLDQVLYATEIENFDIIVAGPSVPNPTEVLDNHFFDEMLTKLRSKYDIILLDAAPLGLVIDPAVMAPRCDGTILVIEQGKTSRKFIQDVKRQLDNSGVRILGAVLNKVEDNTPGYYKRYYKGDYSYYEERK
jgi:capsular exopolysaccharide synthesis family protein